VSSLEEIKKAHIKKMIILHEGNLHNASRALGMGYRTMTNYMRANPEIRESVNEELRFMRLADNSHFNVTPEERDEWSNRDSWSGGLRKAPK
jgi:molybdenum-dependent DNA-binding transcriptional regulator ModE